MPEHTPGPWKVKIWHTASNTFYTIENEQHQTITSTQSADDATLIAAAPDLLAACKYALERGVFPVGAVMVKDRLTSAVSKAQAAGVPQRCR